jgi:hypothetical protein
MNVRVAIRVDHGESRLYKKLFYTIVKLKGQFPTEKGKRAHNMGSNL